MKRLTIVAALVSLLLLGVGEPMLDPSVAAAQIPPSPPEEYQGSKLMFGLWLCFDDCLAGVCCLIIKPIPV